MNESNDALGGQRVYMTQPSLVEQARKCARTTGDDLAADLLEKLADELERQTSRAEHYMNRSDGLESANERLTDAVAELVDFLVDVHAFIKGVQMYTVGIRETLQVRASGLIAKHRPVASEENQ